VTQYASTLLFAVHTLCAVLEVVGTETAIQRGLVFVAPVAQNLTFGQFDFSAIGRPAPNSAYTHTLLTGFNVIDF
jgi:hypothetical protein